MKILKSKFFFFLLGIVISGTVVFAASTINASQITYTDKNNVERTVDTVLDDLYDKANSTKTAIQVDTITTATRTKTYTMQNDGYITGTTARSYEKNDYFGSGIFFTKDNVTSAVMTIDWRNAQANDVSLYAEKGTTISVRNDGGEYNLTIYEWK